MIEKNKKHSTSLTSEPYASTDTGATDDVEWQTYLRHESQLLLEHRGKYAWIVGNEIRAICASPAELCREFRSRSSGKIGIVVKIGQCEAPTFEFPSPLMR
jgi:hypothetical protein